MSSDTNRTRAQEVRLKKHAKVILMHGKLSLVQHKLYNALLLQAYYFLSKQDQHTIPIAELCKAVGYSSRNRVAPKKALRGLISTVVEWGDPTEDEAPWAASSMLSYAELRDATVTYEYNSFMRQKLHNPAVYAAINLTYSHRFGSAYTLRLYEICVRYRPVGSTGWKSIQEWKALLGIEPAQYSAYKDLSKRVVRPAVRKVNKLSDLFLTLETQKGGRGGKVQAIRFLTSPTRSWQCQCRLHVLNWRPSRFLTWSDQPCRRHCRKPPLNTWSGSALWASPAGKPRLLSGPTLRTTSAVTWPTSRRNYKHRIVAG